MQAAATASDFSTGFGAELARVTLALLLVCALAALLLRLLRGRAFGTAGPMRVLARLSLEPRRTLYLVEVAGRCLLVGVGDGPMAVLAEVDRAQLGEVGLAGSAGTDGEGGWRAALRRALGGRSS